MSYQQPVRPARFTCRAALFVLMGSVFSGAVQAQQVAAPVRGEAAASASSVPQVSRSGSLEAGGELLLEGALDRALRQNPEILAALARVDAAVERPKQVHSLPDPVLTGVLRNAGFTDITIGESPMSVAGVRFVQAFPYSGKRDLRAAVAERGIDVSASQVDLTARRVVREVTEAYFELDFLHRSIAIVEDTRSYLVNLEQTAQARYAVGEGIQQDVLKAQVEISVLLSRLVVLHQQRGSAETRVNRMLDRPVSAALGTPMELEVPSWNLTLQRLETDAIASSALLRDRAHRVEQRQAALELARRDTKPDWIIGGAWMTRGALPDIWEVNVGITLPIHKDDKQERAIAEAAAEVRASELDQRDSAGVVSAKVRDLFLRADRAARLQQLYGEAILPQATLSLESATAGYEVGRVDFLTVLDNVVTLVTYQLEYYRQRADYLQALAGLEEQVGSSLGVTPQSITDRLPGPVSASPDASAAPGGER